MAMFDATTIFKRKFIWISFVCLPLFVSISNGEKFCTKIDFNRTTIPEFRECFGKPGKGFILKSYQDTPEIPPYRPTSRYFFAPASDTESCVESTFNLTMNAMTRIEAAIYVKSISNAFVEIIVFDADRNEQKFEWKTLISNGNWTLIKGVILSEIPNARIEIRSAMDAGPSYIGIEYIHFLNLGINTSECLNETVKQTTPSPGTLPTARPPTKPPNDGSGANTIRNLWWMIAFIAVVSIL